MGDGSDMKFEEGIDAYVPVVGSLSDIMDITLAKLKSTMCNSGAATLNQFTDNAVVTRVSQQSFIEGGTSNVMRLDQDLPKYE
jgi:IMP dehydrogenase